MAVGVVVVVVVVPAAALLGGAGGEHDGADDGVDDKDECGRGEVSPESIPTHRVAPRRRRCPPGLCKAPSEGRDGFGLG